MNNIPATLIEVITYFSDKKTCVEFVRDLHWPNGVTCPVCASHDVTELTTRQLWQCKGCRKQFSVKVGTIFEDSAISLTKWLTAMWLMANARNGISSYELSRSLGVTQKTAWFMSHRIREAMRNGSIAKLSGVVEADETFVGGKDKNRHANKKKHIPGHGDTTIVLGMIERGGRPITKVVDSVKGKDLQPEIRKHVEEGTVLYTDSLNSYKTLGADYQHGAVNHQKGEYVRGDVHTNTIESFWALFKRCVKGTHIHLSNYHLDRYLDEECYRYNNRKGDDKARFEAATSQVFGRRLTYNELTGRSAT
jgi:transposase-like protein